MLNFPLLLLHLLENLPIKKSEQIKKKKMQNDKKKKCKTQVISNILDRNVKYG